jgi:hypothetical protein
VGIAFPSTVVVNNGSDLKIEGGVTPTSEEFTPTVLYTDAGMAVTSLTI